MKLLVSLSSYGNKNLSYLKDVIEIYKSYKKYDVSIDVHCTDSIDVTGANQIIHTNPATTCLYHRQDFIEKQDSYDLYLFAEYDMLIKEHCIDLYLEHEKTLPLDHCLGFIRYENTPVGDQYLIDLWKNIAGYNYIQNRDIVVNGRPYFSLSNVHQACYLLTKHKLKYVIDNTDFNINSLNGNGPELASSGIFQGWPIGPRGIIKKVLPLNRYDLEKCLIHHMADCHCNEPGVNTDPATFRSNTIIKNQLYTDLNL